MPGINSLPVVLAAAVVVVVVVDGNSEIPKSKMVYFAKAIRFVLNCNIMGL